MSLFKLRSSSLKNADFLVKSSFGISVVAAIIVAPFTVNALVQGRILIFFVLTLIVALCFYSIYHCYKGRYLLWLNLFGIIPSISIANLYTFYNMGVGGSFWSYMVVFTMYFVLPPRLAKISNLIFLCIAIFIAYKVLEPSVYLRYSSALLGSSFFILVAVREIFRLQDELKQQSISDPLTGLLNRSSLQEYLEQAKHNFVKNGAQSAVAILDIDHFKKVNDTFGHETGDKVIIHLANSLQSRLSGKELIFRIGGEEFLVLLRNTSEDEAYLTLEAFRALIEDDTIIENHRVTISIGLCKVADDLDWKEWMNKADLCLYSAKENGRNQVVK